MTFRNRVQYLLVHSLMISNREAQELLGAGKVIVNGQVQMENMEITPSDEVYVGDRIIQHALVFKYIAYYKPRGVESTLNAQIPENLLNLLPFTERVYPIGRLDKESEGLLILTNDGDLYNTIIKQENHIQKEYIVTVDRSINDDFIEKMASGVQIMGRMTLPCPVERLDERKFRITLIQGMNRQIRRMCYQLDYEVIELVRVRIGKVGLGDLLPQEFRILEKESIL